MEDALTALVVAAVGYLVGALNPATLIAKAKGIDLAGTGSGNPGATNATRAMGRKVGILVGVLDLLKGFLPALFFSLLISPEAGLAAGLAAVVGHVTSPFLGGKGGRGVATAAGAMLASTPGVALVVFAAFAVVAYLTKWVALASMVGVVVLVVSVVLLGYDWQYIVWAVAIAAIILWRHRSHMSQWRTRLRRD